MVFSFFPLQLPICSFLLHATLTLSPCLLILLILIFQLYIILNHSIVLLIVSFLIKTTTTKSDGVINSLRHGALIVLALLNCLLALFKVVFAKVTAMLADHSVRVELGLHMLHLGGQDQVCLFQEVKSCCEAGCFIRGSC